MGGSLFITRFITIADVQPSNGFFPSAISITEMPNDHTSLFRHVFPSYTSGAMYCDVPQVVSLREQECSNCTAKPKSPTLITPFSEMNRLSGLTSYALMLIPFCLRDG